MVKKRPKLSQRLKTIIKLAGEGGANYNTVADIGCDHGFVSVTLVLEKIAGHVIASDVRPGPLDRAKKHVAEYGLSDSVETLLSDGMRHFMPGNVPDMAIMSGMGGFLMLDIMREARKRQVLPAELLLQPQSGYPEVRAGIRNMGYHIFSEEMIKEDGKYYVFIRCILKESGEHSLSGGRDDAPELPERIADIFGPVLIAGKHPVLLDYLRDQRSVICQILEDMPDNSRDRDGIMKKLEDVEYAMGRYA